MRKSSSKQAVIRVQKADGEFEPFRIGKLRYSLKRAGAPNKLVNEIIDQIYEYALGRDHITTTEIYREAFTLLQKAELGVASRYSLKRAVFDLGPTGFPFEDFVAETYKAMGYTAITRQVLDGACASHELDIVAHKKDEYLGAELKFHNSPGMKSDLKVALYVNARYHDLDQAADESSNKKRFTKRLLITNTKFTKQALRYGHCAGLTLISWSYPKEGNLQDLIEKAHLHPITCLTSLSKSQKERLLSGGNVLCRNVSNNADLLRAVGVSNSKLPRVMQEIGDLCRS